MVGGNVAGSVAGSGVSDVYRSMLAFDGIVSGSAASATAGGLHEHVWRPAPALTLSRPYSRLYPDRYPGPNQTFPLAITTTLSG